MGKIKINNTQISKLYLGNIAVKRAYSNGSIVYDTGVQPTPQPCFEVVNFINQASGDYVDVYVNSESKWYKRNNLNQYEEYGVMPIVDSLNDTTYYTGKLVILSTDSHEYRWDSSAWTDLGSAGTFKRVLFLDGGNNASYGLPLWYYWGNQYKMVITYRQNSFTQPGLVGARNNRAPIEFCFYSKGFFLDRHNPLSTSNNSCYSGDYSKRTYKWNSLTNNYIGVLVDAEIEFDKVVIRNHDTGTVIASQGSSYASLSWYNGLYEGGMGLSSTSDISVSEIKVFDNNGVLKHDYTMRLHEDGPYIITWYDSVLDIEYDPYTYNPPLYHYESIGTLDPPVEYDTKVAPANNVHYNTLAELELMECPWVGMLATIGSDNTPYEYTENGWVLADVPLDIPYLRFTPTETATFDFTKYGLQYSIDGGGWRDLIPGVGTDSIPVGSYIVLRGNLTSSDPDGVGTFTATGNFNASGNVMSLLYGNNFTGQTSLAGKYSAFMRLFKDCTYLKNIDNIVLPATTLETRCYAQMFYNTGITSISSCFLPAMTMTENCYWQMFGECHSLTGVPSGFLPAMTLATGCYSSMFGSCGGQFKNAPALPAMVLAKECYSFMFHQCHTVNIPELPATTLAEGCYGAMFNYRDVNIPEGWKLPATTLAKKCYEHMFANGSMTSVPVDMLPATTLAENCYYGMFLNENSLKVAPVLPAETLVSKCYERMFYNCRSITEITALFTTTPGSSYTDNWVYYLPNTNACTFRKNPNATWDQTISRGNSTVLSNWNITDYQEPEYLKFTVVDDNGSTFKFGSSGLKYRIDGGNWNDLAANTDTSLIPKNSTIEFKGFLIPNGSSTIGRFYSSGQFNASGKLMTLLYGEYYTNQTGKMKNAMFRQMFHACTGLISAYNLEIPANAGSYNYACYYMFCGCSNMTDPPKYLKGTSYVSNYAFDAMFANTPITYSPIIYYMFPAYDAMTNMFSNCTNLSTVTLFFNTNYNILGSSRSYNWLSNVASTGTFNVTNDPSVTWMDNISRGTSTIPPNWTIVKIDPSSV